MYLWHLLLLIVLMRDESLLILPVRFLVSCLKPWAIILRMDVDSEAGGMAGCRFRGISARGVGELPSWIVMSIL